MILRKNTRALYYPVGLVSLMFIPLIYFLAINKSKSVNERLLSCWFLPQASSSLLNDDWNLGKVYTTINLTEDEAKNEKAILKGRLLVRALVKSQSTIKGVHFKLCDEMKFESFIELLNTFELEGLNVYVINGDNIWVLNPQIRKFEFVRLPPM